ncbi:MAG: hypothetical protein RL398_2050 [Planctomycetota bacterium]|jgi:hypothetical protein
MPKFLLILRGDPATWRARDKSAVLESVERFEAWAGRLLGERRFVDGKKLADGEGCVLRGDKVEHGPFGAGAEVVRGYHVIEADDYEHAVRLCVEHPELADGGTVEVRRLASMGE